LALLVRDTIHFLVHQLDEVPDVALGKDVRSDLLDDEPLKAFGAEPGGVAGTLTSLEQ